MGRERPIVAPSPCGESHCLECSRLRDAIAVRDETIARLRVDIERLTVDSVDTIPVHVDKAVDTPLSTQLHADRLAAKAEWARKNRAETKRKRRMGAEHD